MNQNFTVLLVLRSTLRIMIDANRYILLSQYHVSEGYFSTAHLVKQTRCYREDIDISVVAGSYCCLCRWFVLGKHGGKAA